MRLKIVLTASIFCGMCLGDMHITSQLPQSVYADTEVSTNVPFCMKLDDAGMFSFSLSASVTASNNIQLAFGCDSNTNGILELEEVEMVVGWDCGKWFLRNGCDGDYVENVNTTTSAYKTLSWGLRINKNLKLSRLTVTDNNTPLFEQYLSACPEWLYNPEWNMFRMIARGGGITHEGVQIKVKPDGFALILR